MIRSMTAFATRRGEADGAAWTWEMRGVNGRGLDLRLRLPEGVGGLEQIVRADLGKVLARGSVTVSLKLSRAGADTQLALDETQLDRVLHAFALIESRALDAGLTLSQPTPADVLAARGVIQSDTTSTDMPDSLISRLRDDLNALLEDFLTMREAEGGRLRDVIESQLTQIETLTADASAAAEARKADARASLTTALKRVVEDIAEVSEDRVAQELALLAVKQDVTEELDRLTAHIAAARALLDEDKPAGRKLDFLAQEFNREANTLCSKAQNAALTAIGLDLKAAVDQMREQIQNVE